MPMPHSLRLNEDGTILTYPYYEADLKYDLGKLHSFPEDLSGVNLTHLNVWPVTLVPAPVDSDAYTVAEASPTLTNGAWTQRWELTPRSPDEVAAILSDRDRVRVAKLWQAAHDLEYNAISGSAVGLITMGVMTGKPKCIAVQNWIKSIWTEYYKRKADGSEALDFSGVGECPHSVPELMQELGV